MFASHQSKRQSTPSDTNPSRFSFAVLVLSMILLALGCIIAWVGWHSVATRHYEMAWKSRSTLGSSNGVAVYTEADAVRMGVGLGSFGVMFFTWGSCLVAGFFKSRPNGPLQKFKLLPGWVSFVTLSLGCVCVYPPWRLTSLSFYTVILIIFGVFPCGARPGFPRLAKVVLPCLIALAVILGNLAQETIAIGMLLGIFVSVGLLVHVFVMFPKLVIPND